LNASGKNLTMKIPQKLMYERYLQNKLDPNKFNLS